MEVIIRPVLDCNIACAYCYASPLFASSKVMKLDDAYLIINEVCDYAIRTNVNNIKFLWHGGEPLLWDIKNFKAIFEYTKNKLNLIPYSHAIQTNLILLNDTHIELFKKYNVAVCSSLDGPKYLHDFYRLNKNKKGTFDVVYNNIKKIQDNNLHINVVAVGSSLSIGKIREIYDFMNTNNINFKFDAVVKAGKADFFFEKFAITPAEYANAMIQLFDIWVNDKASNINISFFTEITSNIATGKASVCTYKANCSQKFMSIDPMCNVYPCCFFYGNESFLLGNIKQKRLLDIMLNSPILEMFKKREQLIEEKCRDCKYYKICYGGCPYLSYSINGELTSPTHLCEAYKLIFSHIEEFMKSHQIY